MMAEEVINFIDFIEELDGDNRTGRPRIYRPRPDWLQSYDDLDFKKRFRMSKMTVLYILGHINHKLEYTSDRNNSVPPVYQLLITLRFCATGSHLLMIGDYHGVDISTVSRIIEKVVRNIAEIFKNTIKMPVTQQEISKVQQKFYAIAQFPAVVGTIDCTHVKIQSPGGPDAEIFRNRKGYFSINVQTISDADLKIQNIVARWPGSTHDSAIFSNSRVCQEFETGMYGQACLLGDSGYPLKSYLLTPYLNPNNEMEERFNRSQILTRNTVERQYGVLKRRFPSLALGLRIKLTTTVNLIVACAILHNICIDRREILPPIEIDDILFEELINNGEINGRVNYEGPQNGEDRRRLVSMGFME